MLVFFFNDTATTEIYTLSLHDALPISPGRGDWAGPERPLPPRPAGGQAGADGDGDLEGARLRVERGGRLLPAGVRPLDRKSTRLNSSHANISYAVFCLKKKKIKNYSNS